MRELLHHSASVGAKGSPYGYNFQVMQAGWFKAPAPFGQPQARLPPEMDDKMECVRWYPTAYVIVEQGWVRIWCQHILAKNTRSWVVHWGRIVTIYGVNWE